MDKNVVKAYGAKATLFMLKEECGELIAAISHYERMMYGDGYKYTKTGAIDRLNQAIADVENALMSVEYICEDLKVEEIRRYIKEADEKARKSMDLG